MNKVINIDSYFDKLNSFKDKKIYLTIGNFDGVHLGHQDLFKQIISKSKKNKNAITIAITFNPHPKVYFYKKKDYLITASHHRFSKILDSGIDYIVVLPFEKIHNLKFDEFLDLFILPFKNIHCHLGHDFSLGSERKGDFKHLKDYFEFHNISYSRGDVYKCAGKIVSSSMIRKYLKAGNIDLANDLLGYQFSLFGTVGSGFGNGSKIGFPTLNMVYPSDAIIPKRGVYLGQTQIKGETIPSVTNIGINPTLELTNSIKVETHLIGKSGDFYGNYYAVNFLMRLRDEKKFNNIELLINQITKDVDNAKKYFSL